MTLAIRGRSVVSSALVDDGAMVSLHPCTVLGSGLQRGGRAEMQRPRTVHSKHLHMRKRFLRPERLFSRVSGLECRSLSPLRGS